MTFILLSESVSRRNSRQGRCVLVMICLRKQAVAMVVMNRRLFELESSSPASGKIHEHFVLPESEKTEAITRISHCLVPCVCGVVGVCVGATDLFGSNAGWIGVCEVN